MDGRILIVEADEVFRRNLTARLGREDLQTYQTGQLDEMRGLIQRRNIDVALLGLVGFKEEALVSLKALKRSRSLAEVILLNKPDSLALSIEGMKLGAFDDLLIPFDLETLLDRIGAACQKKRERAKKRVRKSPFRLYQRLSVAITFAEAGEHETARRLLMDEKD